MSSAFFARPFRLFALAALFAGAAAQAATPDVLEFDKGIASAQGAKEQFLGDISPDSIEALSGALGHEKDRIRFWAVRTLGEIPDRAPEHAEAVRQALRNALADRSLSVRSAAAQGLASLWDPSGEGALIEALGRSDPLDLVLALQSLEKVGGKAAVPALIELLAHPDPAISSKSFWVLAAITGQSFGKEAFLSSPIPDLGANPEYQQVANALIEVNARTIEETGQTKEDSEKQLNELRTQKRRLVTDLVAQGKAQRRSKVEAAAIEWTEWLSQHKDDAQIRWILDSLQGQPVEIAEIAAGRLARVAAAAQVPELFRMAAAETLAPRVRKALAHSAGVLAQTEHLAGWIDFLEQTSRQVQGKEPADAKAEMYLVVDAATELLRLRTGVLAEQPADWKAWRARAEKIQGFRFGRTFFLTAETAVLVPERTASGEAGQATLYRWDASSQGGRWLSQEARLATGQKLGAGEFDTGWTLESATFQPATGTTVWQFKDAAGRQRRFHAR